MFRISIQLTQAWILAKTDPYICDGANVLTSTQNRWGANFQMFGGKGVEGLMSVLVMGQAKEELHILKHINM